MQALELLVSKSAALNAKDADGQTPMHYAALSEHEQVSLNHSAMHCYAAGVHLSFNRPRGADFSASEDTSVMPASHNCVSHVSAALLLVSGLDEMMPERDTAQGRHCFQKKSPHRNNLCLDEQCLLLLAAGLRSAGEGRS